MLNEFPSQDSSKGSKQPHFMRKIPPPYDDPAPLFRHGGAPAGLLDFSASINPLGPPESVLRAIKKGIADIGRYPDPTCHELTARLAAEHRVDPSQIVVGNGSNELIYAVARALRPKRVAIVEPTYTEYLRASLLAGASVDHWLARSRFCPFDPGKASLVWVCHPNNPTGNTWASGEILSRWIAQHPQCYFAVDEAFLPPRSGVDVPRWCPRSLLSYADRLPNLVVIRSLTKFFALPGLRLGYTVSDQGLASRIRSELPPWSVNSLAQRAGVAALDDQDYWRRTVHWLQIASPVHVAEQIATVSPKLRPLASRTMFVLVRLREVTSGWLTDHLALRGIRVRDASNFVGLDDRYVRIAIRSISDNARLMRELAAVLAKENTPCPAP